MAILQLLFKDVKEYEKKGIVEIIKLTNSQYGNKILKIFLVKKINFRWRNK